MDEVVPDTKPKKPKKLTHRQKAFLKVYEDCGNKRKSAEAAGVNYHSHYSWMESDVYAAAYKEAHQKAGDKLLAEAWRRGHDGVEEPRFDKDGNEVGTVTKYSDACLALLIKFYKPDDFKERHELTGAGGSPLVPAQINHTLEVNVTIREITSPERLDGVLGLIEKHGLGSRFPELFGESVHGGNGNGNGYVLPGN